MKNDTRFFVIELKKHYSAKYLSVLLILVLLLLSPILFLRNNIEFAPAEFVNLYLSTVFTAVLIAVILQMMELYRTSLTNYKKVSTLLNSIVLVINQFKSDVEQGSSTIDNFSFLLKYYKESILQNFIADNDLNLKLLNLYNRHELDYVIQSCTDNNSFNDTKKRIVLQHINAILNTVNTLIAEL